MPAEHHEITWTAERAKEFIVRGSRSPWLLSANIFAPHPPFDPAPEYLRRMDPRTMPMPVFAEGQEREQQRFAAIDHQTQQARSPASYDAQRMKAAYYAMIEHIDWAVGAILDSLSSTGQRDNTLIVFTSDHGDMLGDHGLLYKGCRFFEGAVHVPLIVSWPAGGVRRGVTSDALVELTDIAPTLLDAARLPPAGEMDGRSLLPVLRGDAQAGKPREAVICEYHDALDMPDHTRATMIRDRQHKLVRYHGRRLGELFDLAHDPGEIRNLWDDPAARSVRDRLTEHMLEELSLSTDVGTPRRGRY
jgi:arylsulfatase A-like enzyme